MLVNLHPDMKRLFDVRHRPAHVHQHPVGMLPVTVKPLALAKAMTADSPVRRAKLLGELFGRQVMAVVGTGRIVYLLEQIGQRLLVAQRQADGQIQLPEPSSRPEGCKCAAAAGR